MADLSPNLQPYEQLSQSARGGFGSMSPGGILSLVQQSRELNTQQAISDALKSSLDPSTGQINYGGALGRLVQSGAMLTPQNTSAFNTASGVATQVAMDQLRKAADLVAYQADDPNLSFDKVDGIEAMMHRANIPPQVVDNFHKSLPAPTGNQERDRANLQAALVNWQTTLTGGHPPGFGELPGTAGGGIPMSPAQAALVNRGLAPAPGNQGAGNTAGGGSLNPPIMQGNIPLTTPPTGMGAPLEASAKASADLLDTSWMGQQFANLENLRALNQEAISGPQSGFEKRVNELGQRLGVSITADPKKLAASEEYAKVAELLVQQSPAFGHSNAFLENARNTIPHEDLSRLGREGITDWLRGSFQAQKFMAQQWQQWLSMPGHAAFSNQFQNWLNSKRMPDGSPGFDAPNFDPRVFQYLALPTRSTADDGSVVNPRKMFTDRMNDRQVKEFVKNLTNYGDRGWVNLGIAQ